MKLPPTGPLGLLLLHLRFRLDSARSSPQRGASAVEWVIITAVLLALAGVVGWAIYEFVSDAANDLEVPDLPDGP